MQIHRSLAELPTFRNAVITIGTFDGVHLAHRKILNTIIDKARSIDGESILISFHPHPRLVVYPKDQSLQLLNSIDEKISLLQNTGLDHLVIVPFTVEFSQLLAREYIENFLLKNFNPSAIVIGYDHRFGLNREGNINLLKSYESPKGFSVEEISKQQLEASDISSTKIRNALLSGNLDLANQLLGYPYLLQGKVVHGEKIGKSLGYPTANIALSIRNKLLPDIGVYAIEAEANGKSYKGMSYIGSRPTINDDNPIGLEVNLFDFDEDLYGRQVTVHFVKYIRGDMKFDSLDELKDQIAKDKKDILFFFTKNEGNFSKKEEAAAIAVLNYNGNDLLNKYLPSHDLDQYPNSQYYLIDNQSSDDSLQTMQRKFQHWKIIPLSKNHGYAGGYNKGLQNITEPYLALVNSDVEVDKDWLVHIVNLMEKDREIAVCQPKILQTGDKTFFEYAGAAGGWMDRYYYPFCEGRIFDTLEKDEGQFEKIKEIFWASGAAFVVRRDVFFDLGGFDETLFAHQEEIDFCWRAKRAGYKICYVPNAKVYHQGGATLNSTSPQKLYLNFRNNLLIIWKNRTGFARFRILMIRRILDFVAMLQFLLKGKYENAQAVIKAYHHFQFKKLAHKEVKEAHNKLVIKHKIGPENKKGYFKKSIVLQYYLLGKKKFNELF